MEELGRYLRESREAAGLTLQEVQKRTKIRMQYLEALESGNFNAIPGRVYLKGFLQLYAKAVGINPDEVLEIYEAHKMEFGDSEVPPAVKASIPVGSAKKEKRRYGSLATMAALLVVLALLAFSSDIGEKESPPLIDVPAEPQVELDTAGDSTLTNANEPVSQEDGAIGNAKVIEEAEGHSDSAPLMAGGGAAGSSIDIPPEPQADQASTEAAETEVATAPINLKVTAVDQCWMDARADGERVFFRTLKSGEETSFSADERLVIKFGNPAGVVLTLNGTALGPAGVDVVTRTFDLNLVNRVEEEGAVVYQQIVEEEARRLAERRQKQRQEEEARKEEVKTEEETEEPPSEEAAPVTDQQEGNEQPKQQDKDDIQLPDETEEIIQSGPSDAAAKPDSSSAQHSDNEVQTDSESHPLTGESDTNGEE